MTSISVVMPAYNAGCVMERALQSLKNQTCEIGEIIIVDDGSTDNTADIAIRLAHDLPIRLLRNERNLGIGVSLCRGVDAAEGDLILRLDADDRWLPDHARCMAGIAECEPEAVLFSACAVLIDERGHYLKVSSPTSDNAVRAALMWDNPLIHSATGFRRSAYESAGGYREGVRWNDYDLWIRLLKIGELAFWPEPTVEYIISRYSLSRLKRSVSIRARWVCQLRAIHSFWQRHPVTALRCLVVGSIRAAVADIL